MADLIPAGTLPAQLQFNWGGAMGSIMYYVGYALLILLIFAIFIAIYYLMKYNIKVKTFPLYGSGKDDVLSVGKPKNNRFAWNKSRTAWKPLFPLFNKLEIEPFDQEFRYPGNQTYAFIFNDAWIPGRINVGRSESQIRAEVAPVPYYLRNWQSLAHKKNAFEFSSMSWWDQNKMFIYALIAVGICCAMCAITIYLSYKYAAGGREEISGLTSALNNFGQNLGINVGAPQ